MTIYLDETLLVAALIAVLPSLGVWLVMAMREPYIHADGWNEGYERGIKQGLREAAEEVGGPPAPFRIESRVL